MPCMPSRVTSSEGGGDRSVPLVSCLFRILAAIRESTCVFLHWWRWLGAVGCGYVVDGLYGLGWLALFEDEGVFHLVAWWGDLVGWVVGDEFVAYRDCEDLAYADVVVVNGFAAASYAELVEGVFDVTGFEFV